MPRNQLPLTVWDENGEKIARFRHFSDAAMCVTNYENGLVTYRADMALGPVQVWSNRTDQPGDFDPMAATMIDRVKAAQAVR